VGRKEDPGITKEPHPIAQPMDRAHAPSGVRVFCSFGLSLRVSFRSVTVAAPLYPTELPGPV